MFDTTICSANAELRSPAEFDGIIEKLQAQGYRPVLRSAAETLTSVAEVDIDPAAVVAALDDIRYRSVRDDRIPYGEVFFREESAFVLRPLGSNLIAAEVHHHSDASAVLDFCNDVETAARDSLDGRRLRGMSFDWAEIDPPRSRRYTPYGREDADRPELVTQPVVFDETDLAVATALVSGPCRSFSIRLAQVGKARSVDAGAEADVSITSPLLAGGVIRREYLVVCRQDSRTLCTVTERTELSGATGSGPRCSVCGRAFGEELIQEIYALTDAARRGLTNSRWMNVWLTNELEALGVPRSAIAWNAAAGEDEIDVMVDLLGQKIFFELKDREFGLGDAYPFMFRVSRYGGDIGVVISTEKIGEEAKRFLQERREGQPAAIRTIEGLDNASSEIDDLMDWASGVASNRVVFDLVEQLNPALRLVLNGWRDAHRRGRARSK